MSRCAVVQNEIWLHIYGAETVLRRIAYDVFGVVYFDMFHDVSGC